jgi:hypothetical protein
MRKSEATLGSSHEADIVLDGSDLDDEQYEIRVDLAGRVWLLEFKDQTVRGQLQPNQSWELGEYSITLLSAPRRLSPIERHVPNPEQHNRRPRPQANFPSEPPGYALTVTIRSPDEGEVTTRTFEHVREIDIGRGRERTISLPYRGVGRLHCTLMISERGEVFVRDHYSLNGTLVQKRSVEDIALLLPGHSMMRPGSCATRQRTRCETVAICRRWGAALTRTRATRSRSRCAIRSATAPPN